jgi:hypothetical protein
MNHEEYMAGQRGAVSVQISEQMADLGSQLAILKDLVADALAMLHAERAMRNDMERAALASERAVRRQAETIRILSERLRAAGMSERVAEDEKAVLGA